MATTIRRPAVPGGPPADPGTANPHDRDESAGPVEENAQHRDNRKPIAQAHRDVEGGIEDTERIGIPSDVPKAADNAGG